MDLKISDIEELLQKSRNEIIKMINKGELPSYKINNQYLFNKAEINEWILKNKSLVSEKVYSLYLSKQPLEINELVKKGGIYYGIKGDDSKSVLSSAVDTIKIPANLSKKQVLSSLIEREDMMPTSIGRGIAIPHPRNPIISEIEEESISICFPEKETDYNAADGVKVHTIFILLAANSRRHLESLARLMYLCQQKEFISVLKERKSAKEITEAIKKLEQKAVTERKNA